MNPFEELLKSAQENQEVEAYTSLQIPVGKYMLDTTVLLTDDLAAIFTHFMEDEEMIDSLVDYVKRLPYSIKIDMMFYMGANKKVFKKLKKIKSFNNFLDDFSMTIAELKLK